MQRVHNPVTPFAKYSNFNKNVFQTKNPMGVRNASIIQSLRSQNIQILIKTLFLNPKFNGRTQCVQNHQNSKFRQATRTIALFAEKPKFQQIIQIT